MVKIPPPAGTPTLDEVARYRALVQYNPKRLTELERAEMIGVAIRMRLGTAEADEKKALIEELSALAIKYGLI